MFLLNFSSQRVEDATTLGLIELSYPADKLVNFRLRPYFCLSQRGDVDLLHAQVNGTNGDEDGDFNQLLCRRRIGHDNASLYGMLTSCGSCRFNACKKSQAFDVV